MHPLRLVSPTSRVALAALLGFGIAATPAQADTIPFTSAFTGTITPAASAQHVDSDSQAQQGSTPPDAAAAAQSLSGAWGSASASASADIASGQLGGRAAVNYADASPFVFSQFLASIGDGFRTFDDNNAPFVWDGQTASFTLDVDGDIFAPAHIQNVSAYVSLILYSPGSVQPGMNFFGDDGKIEQYLYHIGNPNQQTYYSPDGVNQVQVFPTAYLGNPSSGVHINQAITPGGDFDWVLLMHGSGYLTEPGSLDVDLSHTVTFGYTGPAGATTTSVSGAFNNFNNPGAPVPEPTTFGLVGWGVCAVFARRLRRTKG